MTSDAHLTSPENREPGVAELRVLSHPTRLALLRRLRTRGPSTARALGREFELDSGATSYHLRRLAASGLIREDTSLGTQRERWWQAAEDVTQFDPALHDLRPASAYVHANLLSVATELQEVAAAAAAAPAEWLARSVFIDHRLDLGDADAAALRTEMLELVARYRERSAHDARTADRDPVVVQVQLYRRP